jgi:hypothetical protein
MDPLARIELGRVGSVQHGRTIAADDLAEFIAVALPLLPGPRIDKRGVDDAACVLKSLVSGAVLFGGGRQLARMSGVTACSAAAVGSIRPSARGFAARRCCSSAAARRALPASISSRRAVYMRSLAAE